MECHTRTVKSRQRKDSSACSASKPVISVLILASANGFYHLRAAFIRSSSLSLSQLLDESLGNHQVGKFHSESNHKHTHTHTHTHIANVVLSESRVQLVCSVLV